MSRGMILSALNPIKYSVYNLAVRSLGREIFRYLQLYFQVVPFLFVNKIYCVDVQLLCNWPEMLVMVKDAAIIRLGYSGNNNIYSRNRDAFASQIISGRVCEHQCIVTYKKSLKCIQPCIHSNKFILIAASL